MKGEVQKEILSMPIPTTLLSQQRKSCSQFNKLRRAGIDREPESISSPSSM